MQNKTKENDVNTLVKYDMPWPCLNILPNCDHTKIMCPNCAHQTGMLYRILLLSCNVCNSYLKAPEKLLGDIVVAD